MEVGNYESIFSQLSRILVKIGAFKINRKVLKMLTEFSGKYTTVH